ncbi:MAG: glycerophosphodiester phosphodiesterase [Gaiella sp.]
MVVEAGAPGGRAVIDLRRPDGGHPLRIGHRGAAHLAPENTVRALRAAVEHGCDLVEFDVLALRRGPLVLAHSDHLDEVSHGAAQGSVTDKSLAELRAVAPELPTLDDALAFFAEEATGTGLHIDLKLDVRLDELARAVVRHGLEGRTVVSSFHAARLRTVASHAPRIRIGFTYPEDRFGVAHRPHLWPIVGLGLSTMRASVPVRIQRLTRRAGASALMLQHRLVTERAVARAHELGLPVLAWTVDDRDELARVAACGVDGVITNDPRIFSPPIA